MNSRSLVSLSVVLALLLCCCQARKDHNAPHPHRGLLKQHSPGPFDVKLSGQDEGKLLKGEAVMKQTMPPKDKPDAAGTAICVQDVAAPREAVWNQILDLNSYKGKVPKVNESKNYVVKKNDDGSRTIKTKMVLGVLPGYAYESYYDHKYYPKESSLCWTLDYDKTSDFDDVAGHWHVDDHPSKPQCSRVFYACDIKIKGKVPGPIMNYIGKAALKQATGWVKRESEKKPEASLPTEFAPAYSTQ